MKLQSSHLFALLAFLVYTNAALGQNAPKQLELISLARMEFGKGAKILTKVEEDFFQKIALGETVDLSDPDPKKNDPGNGNQWGPNREIEASRISWLCTNLEAAAKVTHRGINLRGLKINGAINLRFAVVDFPIIIEKCYVPFILDVSSARLFHLSLDSSFVRFVGGSGVRISGDALLGRGFSGQFVSLENARIGGILRLDGAIIKNPKGVALNCNNIKVDKQVQMHQFMEQSSNGAVAKSFSSKGLVTFLNAEIGGDFNCRGARFAIDNPGPESGALDLSTATIRGSLFLSNGSAAGGIRLLGTTVHGLLNCNGGEFLNEGFWAINAEGCNIGGSVFLRPLSRDIPFRAEGMVDFNSAVVGGTFSCEGGSFSDPKGFPIRCLYIKIGRSLLFGNTIFSEEGLAPFIAVGNINGNINLLGADVGNDLRFSGGEYKDEKFTIDARNVIVGGDVSFANVVIDGPVSFDGAVVERNFECADSKFNIKQIEKSNTIVPAINLSNVSIGGEVRFHDVKLSNQSNSALYAPTLSVAANISLDKVEFYGSVVLEGAVVKDAVSIRKCTFNNPPTIDNPDRVAISAEKIDIGGNLVFANDVTINGHVNLRVADIGGLATFSGTWSTEKKQVLLRANGIHVKRTITFDDEFSAVGDVLFLDAVVDGNLVCGVKSKFEKTVTNALALDSLLIKGSVFLGGNFIGNVRILGAIIGGDLDCKEAEFSNSGDFALLCDGVDVAGSVQFTNTKIVGKLSLRGATISNHLHWRNVEFADESTLDLTSTTVTILQDEASCWPKKDGSLLINGFVYQKFGEGSPASATERLNWLEKQPKSRYFAQPYVQLAAVFRNSGKDQDAIKVLIKKENDAAKVRNMTWNDWIWWRWIAGTFIGYGYRPFRAFWVGSIVIVIGSFVFRSASKQGILIKMDKTVPKFNPVMYSLDMFAPLINLFQAKYRLPNARTGSTIRNYKFFCAMFRAPGIRRLSAFRWFHTNIKNPILEIRIGAIVSAYMWLHVIAGWTLTTLLVVGLTGLVKT